jgi:beta-barrel assembly-enhancing protease
MRLQTGKVRRSVFLSIVRASVVVAGMTLAMLSMASLAQVPPSTDFVADERDFQLEQALLTYLERLRRLHRVGSQLRIVNADLCGENLGAEYGFLLAGQLDLPFPRRQGVLEDLHNEEARVVLIATPGLPAYEAGLREGDVLERIVHVGSGQNLFTKPRKKPKSAAFGGKGPRRTDKAGDFPEFALRADLLSSISDEGIEVSFARDGYLETVSLRPEVACAFNTYLSINDGVNAYADGSSVVVNYGMMRFFESDDELALLLGHEYSHNVLRHPQQKADSAALGGAAGTLLDLGILATTGIYTPTFGSAGYKAGSLSFSVKMESQADHLGGYFARRAGYDISVGIPFWRRMGIESPSSIVEGGFLASHPPAPDRVNKASLLLAEIEELERLDCPLYPDLESIEIRSEALEARPRTTGPGARRRQKNRQRREARNFEDSLELLSVSEACRQAKMGGGQ